MRKNILLIVVLVLVMAVSGIVLVGCDGDTGGGDLNGGGTNIPDDNTPDPSNPGTPTEPVITNPVKQSGSMYFDGAKTIYTNNSLRDESNQVKSFETLLTRQLETLSQELLIRLGRVYGYNSADYANVSINGFNYDLTITNKTLISDYITIGNNTGYVHNSGGYCNTLDGFDHTCENCFANAFRNGGAGYIAGTYLNLENTIRGGYNVKANGVYDSTLNTNEAWVLTATNSQTPLFDYAKEFVNNNYETVKTGLANVLAGTNDISFSEAVAKINHLGFTNQDVTNITNYVYNNIIGQTNVNLDATRKPTTNLIDPFTALTNEERAYKGYQVVVPAIVNQTINHKFDNENKNVFVFATKTCVSNVTISSLNQIANEYGSLILKPKSATAPLSKIEVKLTSGSNLTADYDVKFIIKNNGTTKCEKVINPDNGTVVTISPAGNTYSFNLAANSSDTQNIPAYNGDNVNIGGDNPWINAIANTTTLDNINNGNSYIEIQFIPRNSSIAFKIDVTGYYDKA